MRERERERLEGRVGKELKHVTIVRSLIYYANDTIQAFEVYLAILGQIRCPFRQAVSTSRRTQCE